MTDRSEPQSFVIERCPCGALKGYGQSGCHGCGRFFDPKVNGWNPSADCVTVVPEKIEVVPVGKHVS